MYLGASLKERDLANWFNSHRSTVSRIISSWTNNFYTLLGSVRIWIDAEDIKAHLPDYFKDFPDSQVIVDSTELKCQTPSSRPPKWDVLQIQISVNFVSSLYEGSVSDEEVFRRSGLADLTEDMAIMVPKGFLISDCVKFKVYCLPYLSKRSRSR